MAAGQLYRAQFNFQSTGDNVLSFNVGDQFTLVSKTDANWWKVRSASGETGLAPITYLDPCPVRNGGPSRSVAYKSLYEWTPQNSQQLQLTQGQRLILVDKIDVSWWTMETSDGKRGMVPVNYIDKLEEESGPAPPANHTPHQINGSVEEGYQQALASIDSNISRLHEEATQQGGMYTSKQRTLLQSLVQHRQQFVTSNSAHSPSPSHTHSYSLPDTSSRISPTTSPLKKDSDAHQSPLPKRHAPPPPSSAPPKGNLVARRSSTEMNVARSKGQGGRGGQMQRYSLYVGSSRGQEDAEGGYHFNSLPRRKAPPPPTTAAPVPHSTAFTSATPTSSTSHQDKYYYSLQRSQTIGGGGGSSSGGPSPSTSPQRRRRSNAMATGRPPTSPEKTRRGIGGSLQGSPQQSPQQSPRRQRSTSTGSRKSSKKSSASPQHTPSSPQTSRSKTTSKENGPQKSTSNSVHSRTTAKDEGTQELQASEPSTPKTAPKSSTPSKSESLSTSFTVKEANQVVELVRSRADITHYKAQLAVGGVLLFLKDHAPATADMADMADALIKAIEQAQLESNSSTVSSKHKDLQRLQEIFFEVAECKDDSQQRGWAVHDDEGAISGLLEELLQILCDANPEVSKVAVMEDKYENILTLITYYQMEPRLSIRLLLLKVFGVLCGLDRTVVGILLASVLPNELGRDIQQNTVSEMQKTLYSCTVCTMIFSTAEAVPLSVYDQWDEDYVLFLMEKIESPPEEDVEDQLPDSFINMLLGFNQHFPDPASNLVMKGLRRNPNPRNLSEKLMYLVNRGEDPVAITEPCCPDSMTKFLLDVFSDRATSGLFYTTDMRVLIDIVTRQLNDLCPGMESRTHYLELLYRIVGSTDYSEHKHRQTDLMNCLNRISTEEGEEGVADKELVKKIWVAYPAIFDEITDL